MGELLLAGGKQSSLRPRVLLSRSPATGERTEQWNARCYLATRHAAALRLLETDHLENTPRVSFPFPGFFPTCSIVFSRRKTPLPLQVRELDEKWTCFKLSVIP